MRTFLFRLLLDPTASTEGNGTGGADDKGTKAGDDASKAGSGDASKGYEAALAKHGNDAAAMAREIYRDNERIRAENDALKGKVPGEGAVVLNKADAGRWAELGKLGGFDEVKAKLEAGSAAVASVAKFEREKLIGSAASAVGYDPDVLADRAGPDLRIEVKEETKGGKTTRTAEVVTIVKDDKGVESEKRTGLAAYAEANWAKYLPALKAGVSAAPRVGGTPSRTTQARPAPGARPADGGNDRPPARRLPAF